MTKLPTGRHTQQIKSSKKDKVRYMKNKTLKTKVKTFIKKVSAATEAGETTQAQELFPATARHIDIAASKGTIHKNKASRLKSRLSKKINQSKTQK